MLVAVGSLNVVISDELEQKFREEIGRRLGTQRGNLAKAVEEALDLWLKHKEK